MTQNPLLPNTVKPLSASLNVHHFPVANLHLRTQHSISMFGKNGKNKFGRDKFNNGKCSP